MPENAIRDALPESGDRRRRVLVVDDSRVQRLLTRARIVPLGYEVLEAEDGDAALAILREDPVPLVICDWMMPGLTGPELCREIRRLGAELYVYVILLTARSEPADVVEGLAAGADDFLSKPVGEAELMARLTAGQRRVEVQAALIERNRRMARAYAELRDLYERLDADLKAAAALQRDFLPAPHARVNGCAVAAHCAFAGHVGGDHVGYFPAGEDRVGLYSIDVAGHGVASSLVAIRLAQHLSAADPAGSIAFAPGADGRPSPRPPHEVVADLNARFLAGESHDIYFTMAYALVDLRAGRATLCQAGHSPAAIVTARGTVGFAGLGGPPVGMFADARFFSQTVELAPGDRLVLYSDGVTDATNGAGAAIGEAGLRRLLEEHAAVEVRDMLAGVVSGLGRATGRNAYEDDLSLVALEMPGRAAVHGAAVPLGAARVARDASRAA